tara:strand:+ start:234 stop:404 length:171 start_codon:yes stop_codon:yes gene_type:complete
MFNIIAAAASFILPGLGQLLQGEFALAVVWFLLGVCVLGMPFGNILAAVAALIAKS